MNDIIFKKTWKRETAWLLLLWLLGIVTYIISSDVPNGVRLVEASVIPIMGFASAVFLGHVYQNTQAARNSLENNEKFAPGLIDDFNTDTLGD